jgi:tetratricopeptide (TPR) repeat protein
VAFHLRYSKNVKENEVDYFMVNYKQILTLALFGMVNLCILGTVVSEEKNTVNDGVEIDELKSDDEAIERLEVVSTDNQPDSEIKDLDETVDTLAALKEEKAELDKLKSEFQGAEELSEGKGEEEKKVEEAITLKNEDKKVQKIEDVVKNGEEIVHPFEIAENLYKLGEYKMALELYKLIDKDKIEDERRIWVLYQMANCYRKQELYDDAVKVYRELRDGFEGTYWSKQAQWYIQDIEWRSRVEEKMVKVIGK